MVEGVVSSNDLISRASPLKAPSKNTTRARPMGTKKVLFQLCPLTIVSRRSTRGRKGGCSFPSNCVAAEVSSCLQAWRFSQVCDDRRSRKNSRRPGSLQWFEAAAKRSRGESRKMESGCARSQASVMVRWEPEVRWSREERRRRRKGGDRRVGAAQGGTSTVGWGAVADWSRLRSSVCGLSRGEGARSAGGWCVGGGEWT